MSILFVCVWFFIAFFSKLRNLCTKHSILLIADEVQSGVCRTGKFFAVEHFPNSDPDILIMAKGIASGFPLSAIVSRKEFMDKQPPGSMVCFDT
jgi:4-aminobutyrate aminotransferase